MHGAKAALGGIGHGQQKALVRAGEHLQTQRPVLGAVAGQLQGIAGNVRNVLAGLLQGAGIGCFVCCLGVGAGHGPGALKQTVLFQGQGSSRHDGRDGGQVAVGLPVGGYGRGGRGSGVFMSGLRLCPVGTGLCPACSGRVRFRAGDQGAVQQAVGIVEGGPQDLAAGQILPGGGNAAADAHAVRVHGQARYKARQGGAVGTQQKDRFLQIACGLLDGQGRKPRIVEACLGHDTIHGKLELMTYLIEGQVGDVPGAPALLMQKGMGSSNGLFSAFDSDIHGFCLRTAFFGKGSCS